MSIKQVLGPLNLGCICRFLMSLHHKVWRGHKPYPAVSILKAQLLKHLWRVPSDRQMALLLKRNKWMARACGFKRETPSHGLFTQFRHRARYFSRGHFRDLAESKALAKARIFFLSGLNLSHLPIKPTSLANIFAKA